MLVPWKKSYDQPIQHIKKQRHYFTNKGLSSVFRVVMYGCESWTIKAERQRIGAFELWCWRRLLRVPWTARRSIQSILKETIRDSVLNIHCKDWCWSWNSNTLVTCYEELIHWKRPQRWKRLRRKEWQRMEWQMVGWHHWHNRHEFEQTEEIVEDKRAWHAAVHGVPKSCTQLSDEEQHGMFCYTASICY